MDDEQLPPSKQISTLFTYDTINCSDSVEWCPHEPHQNILVCANYQLKDSQTDENAVCERFGKVLLFSISPENGLCLLQTIDSAAILDQKWCHNKIDNHSILGVVNAQNTLEIYKLNPEPIQLELITTFKLKDEESETLLLSLDWSTGKFESTQPNIVCSDSKGRIHLLNFNFDGIILENSWEAHEYQAWIAGFNYWDTNIFFSGGDDCVLKKFDKRVEMAVAKNRSHEAGVTSLHSNVKKEYILATGSYDSNVRLWDIRQMKCPINSIKMPGTLWRLKWDPFSHKYLLAACMLGGVHVINAAEADNLEIIESYYKHKNISYGADWAYLPADKIHNYEFEGNVVLGTSSFYDHLLSVSILTVTNIHS